MPLVDGLSSKGMLPGKLAKPFRSIGQVGHLVKARTQFDMYCAMMTYFRDERLLINEPPVKPTAVDLPALDTELQKMMYRDSSLYLPDTIMTKVDRASMRYSLESRAPLLDHRLVEFAWQLPEHVKQRDGTGKWLLREVLYDYLPRSIMDRPKKGFGVPIGEWLRGPLNEWANDLLSNDQLNRQGFLNTELVRQMWVQHVSRRRDYAPEIWSLLMFQSWYLHNHG